MKNRYMIYITLLMLLLSFVLGITYSYLAAKINNPETSSTIAVEAGKLSITYENNSNNIFLNNIIPGDSVTKQFTLTGINTTKPNDITKNTDLKYKIGIVIDVNTFSNGALTYTLTKDSSSSTNGKLANDTTGTIDQSGTQYIGNGNFPSGTNNDKHIYNLTISFPDTNIDQSIDQGASFACHITVEQYIPSFKNDSWSDIASAVSSGNSDVYKVGEEKEVVLSDGTSYTVRIANNSNPNECRNDNFSQSACGFVVEFVDIVERRRMNSTYTNVGGWPDTEIRTYANGEFFNKLPSELQNVIMDTKVISGHGSEDTSNLISTDKIYLLSSHEIWSNKVTHNSNDADTAYSQTRQLDYYSSKGVTTDSYSGAIKQYNSSNDWWWLRTATYFYSVDFLAVYSDGAWRSGSANNSTRGFAPAFRIGENVNNV